MAPLPVARRPPTSVITFLFNDLFAGEPATRFGWIAFAALVLLGGGLLTVRMSAQETERIRFDLPAGEVAEVLRQFSGQSGRQVVVPTELAQGWRTRAVRGELAPAAALEALLTGTPLSAVEDAASGAFAIVRRTTVSGGRAVSKAEALIVVGLAADDAQAERLWAQANAAREAFVARGISPDAIRVLPETRGAVIRTESILAELRAPKPDVEETWVLLLGNIAPGREGKPMFQVNGPRLAADDFAAAVAARPGRSCVIVGAARSGGFLMPLLDVPKVEAVAATAAAGELNEPRFAAQWVEALRARPRAAFDELARTAAAKVAEFYRERKLAQTEHAQIIARTEGKVVPVLP